MARPRTGETPIRHVRVAGELWGRVGNVAERQGRTLSAVVVDALERYVDAELGQPDDDGGRTELAAVDADETAS